MIRQGVHNRWHPDIPPYATVKPGQVFKIECVDWTGAQIGNNDSSDDIKNVDLSRVHNLSGPIAVEGAEPGDCLVVDILDVTPFEKMPWGYTGIFELENGGGLFAREFNSKAAKAIWDFHGVYATSRHIPGVRFAGVSHPGLIGTAPSPELLDTWNKREGALISEFQDSVPPVAFPPEPKGAYVGQELDAKVLEKIYKEGARTIPGREHGGNCDSLIDFIGTDVILWGYRDGQYCSRSRETFANQLRLVRLGLSPSIPASSKAFIFAHKESAIIAFSYRSPLFTEGLPSTKLSRSITSSSSKGLVSTTVNGDGKQYSMDATVAYKQAALNCITYLMKLGYTREQAYILLSAAPVESHVGAVVDSPNACVTLALPVGIFEHDILPKPDGLKKLDFGQCAIRSDGVV
ncbi:hypothetical protein V5O48_005892 [Marasmius crinis-equi]|uniref:Formamidase n=1 Tax=Marasmius crinis-equi TaxID=585013 RepID=A0ABR3FL17_9AGAR